MQVLQEKPMFHHLVGAKEPMIMTANVNVHYELSSPISPALQMRKLGFRDVKQLAHNCTTRKWQSRAEHSSAA